MSRRRMPSGVLWMAILTLSLTACAGSCREAEPGAVPPTAETPLEGAPSPLAIVEIAPGEGHTVALTADGSVWTSGNGGDGQLGWEQMDFYLHGVKVEGLPAMRDVAAGTGYSIFLDEDGTLWGAGYGFDERLGPTASERFTTPVQLGIDGLIDVAAFTNYTLGRREDDSVVAFGVSDGGGLGHGTNADSATLVETGIHAVQIDAGGGFSVGRTAAGELKTWGMNNYGMLCNPGVPTQSMSGAVQAAAQAFHSLSPVDVDLDGVVHVSAGTEHTLIARNDGSVWGCGRHLQGSLAQPGNNVLYPAPVQIPGVSDIVAVAAGTHLSLALDSTGTVYSWGQNSLGQLGRTIDTAYSNEPTPISGLPPIAKIIAGIDRAYAIDRDGGGWAWGNNEYGQLLADGEGLGPPIRMSMGNGR